MICRRRILALLGAGVSAFVLYSSPALAAAGHTFTPATSWAVSRIDPPNGGSAYCTLARRFDGNTVITFARNTTGEGTIAVDFQQPLFDPNQTYRIGLQAGNGLKREFMTRPATPNAVVLRTGQDPQFFEALNGASELGVILDATRYAFSIPDLAAGTGQLTSCIGGQGNVVTKPAPASVGDNAAIADLRAQLNAMKQENANIAASLKQGGGSAQVASTALPNTDEDKALADKLAALENEKSALVDKLQNERARQQQESQDAADLQQALEDQKALKSMLESERAARAQLEASMGEKTADAEKRGELRARVAALESSNTELKTLRETLDTEREKRLAAEKAMQDQKTASASSLEDQERLRARVSELETQNKDLQAKAVVVDDMKAQLEDTGTRAAMERARREAAEKALAEMQLSSSEREAKLGMMEKQIEAERKKMAEADAAANAATSKKHADEIARLNAEMAKMNEEKAAEIARLKSASEASADLELKATAEAARREATERELETARAALADKAAEIAKLKTASETSADMQTKISAETARREATEKQLAEARADLEAKAAEIAKLNAAKDAEMAELKAKGSDSSELQQKIAAETARREATEKELAAAREALDAKQAQISKLSAGLDDADTRRMADQLAELESRNVKLMDQLKAAKANNESAAKASVTTASNDDATNAKIVEIGRKSEADRRELQALLEGEKARREKLEAIMAQGSDSDRLKEMNSQMAELSKRNADLEQRLKTEQASITPAAGDDEQVARLQKQLKILKSDNQMLAEKLASGAPAKDGDAQVVYAGDDQMADALAESKSSLASVMAERDEYRNLLQRERIEKGDASTTAKNKTDATGANARVAQLEKERADLVRQLEFEKSRLEQVAAGKETVAAAPGASESELKAKLVDVESQKAKLKKQLEVAQADVIAARQKMFSGAKVDDKDVQDLLTENKKLQAELAASAANGSSADAGAMQTEIAALRAQNEVLSQEINKRLAAAPTRAAIDNAAAEANYKVKEAKTVAKAEVQGEVQQAQTRYQQAEEENIRLAKALAAERAAKAQQPAAPVMVMAQPQPQPAPPQIPVVVATTQTQVQAPATPRMAPIVSDEQVPQSAPSPMYTPASLGSKTVAPEVGPTGQDIAGFLKRANIPMVSGFEKIRKVSTPQFAAFRWDTGVVFGTAEQQIIPASGFEQAVTAYLTKTKQRCSGTFDQSFDPSQMSTHKNFAVADVACVMPDGTGAGAAIVFYYKDGLFNVVAHEGDIGEFDQAMQTRDSFARFMQGLL